MAEERKVQSSTVITVNEAGQGSVETVYIDSGANILKSIITDSVGIKNGVRHREGDLMISMRQYPGQIDASLNTKGELVLLGKDLDKYSVSPDGDLLYTYEE